MNLHGHPDQGPPLGGNPHNGHVPPNAVGPAPFIGEAAPPSNWPAYKQNSGPQSLRYPVNPLPVLSPVQNGIAQGVPQQSPPLEGTTVLRAVWSWVLALTILMADLVAVTFIPNTSPDDGLLLIWNFVGLGAIIVMAVMVYHRQTKTAVAFKVSAVLALLFPTSPLGVLAVLHHVVRKGSAKQGVIASLVAALTIVVFCLREAAIPKGEGIFDGTSIETGEDMDAGLLQYLVLGVLMLVIPILLGLVQRFRGRVAVLSKESQDLHAAAGDLKVELTRSQERENIARELHDTVAHHIARVAMQANLGEMRATDPDTAKMFQGIRETSQGSMDEMRSLITSLRDSASEGYIGANPVDLSALSDLVAKMRNDGVNVNADISIDQSFSASSAIVNATFRIAREGLTNAVKYSNESAILLSVSALTNVGIFLEITNTTDPAKQAQRLETGTGSGLMGMTERATQLGGYLHSSETEGVWRVRSFLPATERKSAKQ